MSSTATASIVLSATHCKDSRRALFVGSKSTNTFFGKVCHKKSKTINQSNLTPLPFFLHSKKLFKLVQYCVIMVREIIHVQVGQCGNQIGNAFWDTMGKEHKLEANGRFKGKAEEGDNQLRLDKIDVYYQEAGTMRFVPRACLVDLEPGIMDVIKASPMGALFKPDNMCFGASGAGNNWYGVIYGSFICDICG